MQSLHAFLKSSRFVCVLALAEPAVEFADGPEVVRAVRLLLAHTSGPSFLASGRWRRRQTGRHWGKTSAPSRAGSRPQVFNTDRPCKPCRAGTEGTVLQW